MNPGDDRMELRTDLAVEEREILGDDVKGARYSEEQKGALHIERLKITSDSAARMLKKPQGTYITVSLPPLTDNIENTDERLVAIAEEIGRLLPVNGLVLVAGLGNDEITPDALGPKTARGILATRHISEEVARSTGMAVLRPVAVLSTSVAGKTGIESFEHLLGVVSRIRPTAVVVVDALMSRSLTRLGTTLQISDTGISPGAGVGNRRAKIDRTTLGVPVIAVGVPTVVDACTLAADLLGVEDEREGREVEQRLSPEGRTMVVTPKEIDLLIDRAARLISLSLNFALQRDAAPADLLALL